jgi:hypothetical protein
MASLEDAELARRQCSDYLRELGAHAIAVDELKQRGGESFSVVAYFDKKPSQPVPKFLEVKSGKKTLKVPLKVLIAEKFRPEKL